MDKVMLIDHSAARYITGAHFPTAEEVGKKHRTEKLVVAKSTAQYLGLEIDGVVAEVEVVLEYTTVFHWYIEARSGGKTAIKQFASIYGEDDFRLLIKKFRDSAEAGFQVAMLGPRGTSKLFQYLNKVPNITCCFHYREKVEEGLWETRFTDTEPPEWARWTVNEGELRFSYRHNNNLITPEGKVFPRVSHTDYRERRSVYDTKRIGWDKLPDQAGSLREIKVLTHEFESFLNFTTPWRKEIVGEQEDAS